MAIVTTDNRYYSEIASAIREKIGGSALYAPAQMAAAIKSIQGGEAMSIETIWAICGYEPPPELPVGYTLLEYIQSTGTQYINTGFKPNQNTHIIMDVQATATGTHVYWGARTGSLVNTFCCFALSGTSVRSDFGTTQKSMSTSKITSRVIVEQNKNVCTHGELSVSHDAQTFQCDFPLYLLAANTTGSVEYASMPSKVYSCRIYDNGTLVRDFVPCKNPSGVFGLYDMANAQFYGNAGSGSFTGA